MDMKTKVIFGIGSFNNGKKENLKNLRIWKTVICYQIMIQIESIPLVIG